MNEFQMEHRVKLNHKIQWNEIFKLRQNMLIDCLTVNFAAKKEAKKLKLLEIIALSFRIKSASKRRK